MYDMWCDWICDYAKMKYCEWKQMPIWYQKYIELVDTFLWKWLKELAKNNILHMDLKLNNILVKFKTQDGFGDQKKMSIQNKKIYYECLKKNVINKHMNKIVFNNTNDFYNNEKVKSMIKTDHNNINYDIKITNMDFLCKLSYANKNMSFFHNFYVSVFPVDLLKDGIWENQSFEWSNWWFNDNVVEKRLIQSDIIKKNRKSLFFDQINKCKSLLVQNYNEKNND